MSLEDLFSLSPSRTSAPSLQEFVYGEGEKQDDQGYLSKAFELLSRPQLALGETLGALKEKEDPWEAAKKGFAGEGKYGTPGEVLFPPDPKAGTLEALFKKGGEVGVDILADPTWLIGGPLVGKAAGLGAKVASKSKLLRKVAQGLSPAAKHLIPVTTQLRMYGRGPGNKTARLVEESAFESSLRLAQANTALKQKAKQLGIQKNEQLLSAVTEHIESGALRQGLQHADKRVQEFAAYITNAVGKLGAEVETFEDPLKKGFQILEPGLRSLRTNIIKKSKELHVTSPKWKKAFWDHLAEGVELPADAPVGVSKLAAFARSKFASANVTPQGISVFNKEFYRRPFRVLEDYFPRLPTPDFLKSLGTDEGFSKAARELAKLNNVSVIEATKILKRIAGPRQAGNIEYARLFKMPGYEKNPLKALPRYFEQVYDRLAYAKRFGVSGEVLDELLQKTVPATRVIKGVRKHYPGISTGDIKLLKDAILHRPIDDNGLRKIAKAVMSYQVMTKMGPLSTISQLSQSMNTFIRDGGTNFLQGVLRSMTKEGSRQGAIAYAGGVRQSMLRLMGATGKGSEGWLKWTGFTPGEKINRLLASNSGVITAERLLRQSGGKLTRNLVERGLTVEDISRIIKNNWKLPQDIGDRIGLLASNVTQHVSQIKDIPLSWRTPEVRMMMQFKQFVYQQTRFMFKEVVKPALEYFQTNGKKGTAAPLLRAVVGFGLGGQVVAHLRDQAKGLFAKVVGMEHDPREPVPDDWALRALEDSFNMGALGVAGDLVERAAQRDLKGWVIGPSANDFFDIIELISGTGAKAYRTKELDLKAIGRQSLRHIPFVSPIIPRKQVGEALGEGLSDLQRLFGG